MEDCKHEQLIQDLFGWMRVTKAYWKLICSIIGICLILLGVYINHNDRMAIQAQEVTAAIITEAKQERKENKNDIQTLQVAVGKMEVNTQRIEEKVDEALNEANKKQEVILEAIKGLKKDE